VTELYRAGSQAHGDDIIKTSYMKMFDNLGIKDLEVKGADGVVEKIPLTEASDD